MVPFDLLLELGMEFKTLAQNLAIFGAVNFIGRQTSYTVCIKILSVYRLRNKTNTQSYSPLIGVVQFTPVSILCEQPSTIGARAQSTS